MRVVLALALAAVVSAALISPPFENDWDARFTAPAVPKFECKPLTPSATKPTDVNKLRFTDIDVVMSLGDSITAAFAAHSTAIKINGFPEFKGLSWSIGGSERMFGMDVYTLPNFLRRVSGKLPRGASIGEDIPIDAVMKNGTMPYHGLPWVDHLNAAQSEARVEHMPAQVDYLVSRLKADKKINFEEDWKMLTILIGANNGCGACRHQPRDSAETYYEQLNATIAKAQANIPRLFISATMMFNTSGVYTQQMTSKYCTWVQEKFDECGCMEKTDQDRRDMDEAIQSYNVQISRLADEWTARNLKDFKIVAQPALSQMSVPSREFLSGLDCFHPNQYAHGGFAIGLWNNLLRAPGNKSTTLDPSTVVIECPTEDQYLQ